ncbi:MAG: tRNA (adenosine(37)-N6)-dimethylallyltransferase MiaA [Gammaproteobacteria bacterium]
MNSDKRPPALFLMGPTASGKTGLAVDLVKRFPVDIISVDSALIYREMNIGTAKPEADILKIAPHRLVDIKDPSETYSAAEFVADASREMQAITAAGRIPLLVGGTMLYFRALENGLSLLPSADPEIRKILESKILNEGLQSLHDELSEVDPVAARRIHSNDRQRTLRALEVYKITGQSMTRLFEAGVEGLTSHRLLKIILAPAEREILHERIDLRFHLMLENGFLDEVRHLYQRDDLHADLPSMRAVGYRQAWKFLSGEFTEEEWGEKAIIATRQYAKRQFTWLRGEQNAHWLDGQNGRDYENIFQLFDEYVLG